MYDRSKLLAAATKAGDKNANRVATRLGLPRNTAWRLWNGVGIPAAATIAAVEAAYGLGVNDLILPAEPAA